MLKIQYHSKFKKDIKVIKKRNYDLSKLEKGNIGQRKKPTC